VEGERKGKERKGKERKGKERKGKERKGKERARRHCWRHCWPDATADQFGNGPRTTTTTTKSPNWQRVLLCDVWDMAHVPAALGTWLMFGADIPESTVTYDEACRRRCGWVASPLPLFRACFVPLCAVHSPFCAVVVVAPTTTQKQAPHTIQMHKAVPNTSQMHKTGPEHHTKAQHIQTSHKGTKTTTSAGTTDLTCHRVSWLSCRLL